MLELLSFTLLAASVVHAYPGYPPKLPLNAYAHTYAERQEQIGKTCQQLTAKFPSQVFFPNSSVFTTADTDYYSSSAILSPTCVFGPTSAKDISTALAILKSTKAKFAVKGGGHMAIAGSANINDGVLIALQNIDEVTLSTFNGRQVAVVGSGNRWGLVYNKLAEKNLTVTGGRYFPVGAGGLPLGGGISYFNSVRGWSANQVVQYEVVAASGEILMVNAKTYPDLFWALKGGSMNFGIVTKYFMNTFPIGEVYAGFIGNSEANNNKLVDAIAAFCDPKTGGSLDPKSAIDANLFYNSKDGSTVGLGSFFYNGTGPVKALKGFTDLPTTSNTVSNRNYTDFLQETVAFGASPLRSLWVQVSLKSTPDAARLAGQAYTDALTANNATLMKIPGGSFTATWQPITEAALKAAKASGGDALDLDPADGAVILMLYSASYLGAENDAFADKFLKDLVADVKKRAQAKNLYYPFTFLNDAGGWQKTFSLYGKGKSLPKLRSIAKKYDPTELWQNFASGAFKLSLEDKKQ